MDIVLSDTQLDRHEHLIRMFRNVRTALLSNRLPWFDGTARWFNLQTSLLFILEKHFTETGQAKSHENPILIYVAISTRRQHTITCTNCDVHKCTVCTVRQHIILRSMDFPQNDFCGRFLLQDINALSVTT